MPEKSSTMFPFFTTHLFLMSLIVACSSDNATSTVLSDETSTSISNTTSPNLEGKHESILSCGLMPLDLEDYELFPNGSIHIKVYNLTLNESHYIILNDQMHICTPSVFDEEEVKDVLSPYLTVIGLGISMVSLLIHLIIFSIVPDLRNLPGWNLAALCASLFISYLLLFIISCGELTEYQNACIATASLTHFFLLASVLWTTVISYDVFMTMLRATGSFRISSTQFTWKRFGLYCLFSFGIALFVAILSLLSDVLDVLPQLYRPEYAGLCWFSKKTPLLVFFAGPVIALTCLNFIFFGLSAFTIHFNKRTDDQDAQKSVLKGRYLMYFRLSVITGVTWVVGIIAVVADVNWVWYMFVILNTLHGFFIFLAFTCSKKVKKYFREKCLGIRRGSEQTLTPTFQSYCFYANSIEKDLDKIVESSKEKTETIMIHL